MKPIKFISPFFCILFFLVSHLLFSQQKIDSQNFVEFYEKANNTDSLIKIFKFLEKDKEESLIEENYLRAVYDLYYISEIQFTIGEYYDSENSAIQAIKLLDGLSEKSNKSYRKSFLNHLGRLRRHFEDYNKSLEYYFEVLKLSKTKKDSAMAFNNLGVAYKYMKKYLKAKEALMVSYSLNKLINDNQLNIAMSLDNLGYVEGILNENIGEDHMLKSLDIRKQINDPIIYESFKSLTDYYILKQDKNKALYYAEKGLEFARKFNSNPYKLIALRSLIDLDEYKYIREYNELRDQIDSDDFATGNKYANARYDYSRERIQKEIAKTRSILLLSAIILIVLGSGFFFYILKYRHKKEKLQTRFDTERYISKKLHDEVANDMYSMMSKLDNDPNVQKQLVDDLEEVYLKTRDISKAHAALDFSLDYDELLKDLISVYKTENVNIFTRNLSKIPWDSISEIKKETLYRVIQELMTNMKKHSEATLVTLQFEEQKKKILVTYRDNGIGCELKYGNGLRNTENRIDLAGCRITFESEINNGFEANLIL